jgi:predicted nucleic-acid-binding protein
MRAVDTNVLVRLVTGDDERQVKSAESFVEKGVWVSHLVLAETTWVLRTTYEFDHAEIATAIDMLLNNGNVAVQELDVVVNALDHYRSKPKIGFSDCLVLEIAKKAGHLPLGTFDRDLSKFEGTERL